MTLRMNVERKIAQDFVFNNFIQKNFYAITTETKYWTSFWIKSIVIIDL